MNKRNALTLVELLVVIGVLFFLLAIVMPALNRPKEPGKGAVCKANLRDLSIAWIIYADDNDGKLVNGQPGVNADGTLDPADDRPTTDNRFEIPWARGIEIDTATGKPKISRDNQELLIKGGALWPYIMNVKCYRCPGGKAKHMRHYSIVCSLNGDRSPVADRSDARMLCVKNRSLIRRPHDRIVFVDEGCVNNLSFRVGYNNPGAWIDPPPVRHSNGMTFVFADGHSGYWKWKGTGTVLAGEKRHFNYTPQSAEDGEDLRDMRIAVWGEIP
jgi:prepilin-type processing-associated H-X9-DG protein